MRPIDADAYAADLWKLRTNYQMLDDTHTDDKIMHGIFRAEQVLKEQPTIAVSPWHRVEKELPRGQELVIVAVKDTAGDTPFWYTQCGWITTDGEYWIVDNEICDYVVAWMPLPEPPKEE